MLPTKGGGNFVTILLPQLVFIGLLGLWSVTSVVSDVQGTIGEKWPSMDNAEVQTSVLAH